MKFTFYIDPSLMLIAGPDDDFQVNQNFINDLLQIQSGLTLAQINFVILRKVDSRTWPHYFLSEIITYYSDYPVSSRPEATLVDGLTVALSNALSVKCDQDSESNTNSDVLPDDIRIALLFDMPQDVGDLLFHKVFYCFGGMIDYDAVDKFMSKQADLYKIYLDIDGTLINDEGYEILFNLRQDMMDVLNDLVRAFPDAIFYFNTARSSKEALLSCLRLLIDDESDWFESPIPFLIDYLSSYADEPLTIQEYSAEYFRLRGKYDGLAENMPENIGEVVNYFLKMGGGFLECDQDNAIIEAVRNATNGQVNIQYHPRCFSNAALINDLSAQIYRSFPDDNHKLHLLTSAASQDDVSVIFFEDQPYHLDLVSSSNLQNVTVVNVARREYSLDTTEVVLFSEHSSRLVADFHQAREQLLSVSSEPIDALQGIFETVEKSFYSGEASFEKFEYFIHELLQKIDSLLLESALHARPIMVDPSSSVESSMGNMDSSPQKFNDQDRDLDPDRLVCCCFAFFRLPSQISDDSSHLDSIDSKLSSPP